MYIVKDTPIRKNKKTYGVGEAFPHSDKDKKLLWNLTEVEENVLIVKRSIKESPKVEATKKSEALKVEAKQPTAKKKVARKKKLILKNN